MADLPTGLTFVDELFSLRGKVAVVLGGTGVLGGAFCRGLARAGAAVAVLGRSEEKGAALAAELRADGHAATHVAVDATSKVQLQVAVTQVQEHLGGVDILVNAPGINSATTFFELGEEEWHRIVDTNLTSVMLACQVFGAAMVERGAGGSIINISSASSEIPLSRVLTYGVSKAGLNNLTRWLARELAPQGVRVNALIPGFFPAEQNRRILAPERVEAILRHTAMGRLGEPDELLGALIWLASDRAAGFVTGALITVDGGFTAMTI
jgi:NAD(P)-dependent dehydrogenase (short-subunit alcohol dehydrogenase family)